jgi:hypothetical protein
MRSLIAICIIALLTGCVTNPSEPTIIDKPIRIDRELLKLCDQIPQFMEGDEPGLKYIELIGMYGVCANKQKASVDALKEIGNIK